MNPQQEMMLKQGADIAAAGAAIREAKGVTIDESALMGVAKRELSQMNELLITVNKDKEVPIHGKGTGNMIVEVFDRFNIDSANVAKMARHMKTMEKVRESLPTTAGQNGAAAILAQYDKLMDEPGMTKIQAQVNAYNAAPAEQQVDSTNKATVSKAPKLGG